RRVNLQLKSPVQQEDSSVVSRPTSPARMQDPLSDALLYLASYHGRALSREALLTGLPITDGKLTVRLFERAAQRAGLEAEPIKRALEDIPALVLPAVLTMRDGSLRILVAQDEDPRRARVVNPSPGPSPRPQPLGADAEDYLGYAFFVRPASTANPRTIAAGGADLPKAHWFWSVVKRFWKNYTHVAIAAFIVNMLALASPLFTMSVYDRVVPNGAIASLVALSIRLAPSSVFYPS